MRGIIPLTAGRIAWLEIHDGDFRQTFYEPTIEDISDVAYRNNLVYSDFVKAIDDATHSGAHGVLINIPAYKEEQLRNSVVHFYYSNQSVIPYCRDKLRGEWVQFDHTAVGKICKDCTKKLWIGAGE